MNLYSAHVALKRWLISMSTGANRLTTSESAQVAAWGPLRISFAAMLSHDSTLET